MLLSWLHVLEEQAIDLLLILLSGGVAYGALVFRVLPGLYKAAFG
jgi:hypothetical protein